MRLFRKNPPTGNETTQINIGRVLADIQKTQADIQQAQIQLSRAQQAQISIQLMDSWLRYFEELMRTGQLSSIVPDIALMYETCGTPFTPVDATIHVLLGETLLGLEEYDLALTETDYALHLLQDHPRLLHRKGLIFLGKAQNETDQQKVKEYFDQAVTTLNAIYSRYPSAKNNPDIASFEGRIYRELWLANGQEADLERSRAAYKRAWDTNPQTQFFPAINYAEMNYAYTQRKKLDLAKADEVFRIVANMCENLRLIGVSSYWLDFTEGEALLALGDFETAKGKYRSGVNRTPLSPIRDRDSALKGVYRLARIKPDVIGPAQVDAIKEIFDSMIKSF